MEEIQMKKSRINLFDNSKAILIFLVVFAHIIQFFNNDTNIEKFLFCFIYTFHMPVFVFVSGFFYKKKNTKKNLMKYSFTYIVFQVVYIFVQKYWLATNPETQVSMRVPVWIMWYVFCLIIWNILTYFIDVKDKISISAVFISSIIMGLISGYQKDVGLMLSGSRMLVYYPFFLFGIIIQNYFDVLKYREELLSQKKKRLILFCMFMLAVVTIGIVLFMNLGNINYNTFYNSGPYEYSYLILYRVISYLSGYTFIGLFLLYMTNKKIPIVTDVGRNTGTIYILHGIIVELLIYLNYKGLINISNKGIGLLTIISIDIVLVLYLIGKIKNYLLTSLKREKGEKDNG